MQQHFGPLADIESCLYTCPTCLTLDKIQLGLTISPDTGQIKGQPEHRLNESLALSLNKQSVRAINHAEKQKRPDPIVQVDTVTPKQYPTETSSTKP